MILLLRVLFEWPKLSHHMYDIGMSKIEELEQQVHGRGRYCIRLKNRCLHFRK